MVSVEPGYFTPPLKYNFHPALRDHPKLKKTSSHLLILLVQTDIFLSNRKNKVLSKSTEC